MSGASSANTVDKIKGRDVSASAPASGNVLAWNGSAWAPAAPTGGARLATFAKSNSFTIQASDFDGVDKVLYFLDTSTNAITVTMISPAAIGRPVEFALCDTTGNANTHNVSLYSLTVTVLGLSLDPAFALLTNAGYQARTIACSGAGTNWQAVTASVG